MVRAVPRLPFQGSFEGRRVRCRSKAPCGTFSFGILSGGITVKVSGYARFAESRQEFRARCGLLRVLQLHGFLHVRAQSFSDLRSTCLEDEACVAQHPALSKISTCTQKCLTRDFCYRNGLGVTVVLAHMLWDVVL